MATDAVAIFGHDAHAALRQLAGGASRDVLPADEHASGRGRDQPGQDVPELALPVALDAREPDDLARPDLEAHVEPDDAGVVLPLEVLELQPGRLARARRHGARLLGQAGVERAHLATDHRAHQRAQVRVLHRDRLDHAAAAHDRRLVRDGADLGQLVGYEHDPAPLDRHPAADVEQPRDLARRQHRGRLVEHEEARPLEKALEDLDPLALADGDVLDRPVEIDLEPELRRQRAHALLDEARV